MRATIVIPTYNRKEYLKKALESIAEQTYEHSEFEVLIIDDFSTDGTEGMVEEFSKEADFHISYFKNDKKGQTMARNKGFKMAKGKIVISSDSDIEASSDWLKNGLRPFEESGVYAVEGRVVMRGEIIPFIHGLGNEEGGTYQTANMFYRREILERVGYLDERLNRWWNFGSDYDLALRMMDKGGRIIFARDAAIYHPVYKIEARAMLKNSLKSGAIPYLYKKHRERLPYHLKMSYRRALSALFVIGFLTALLFLNYPVMLVLFIGAILSTMKLISKIDKVGPGVRIKAVVIYGLGAAINLLAFLYSCLRFGVFPTKKIFRF